MLALGSQARIWLCTQPTDMRKSFDGLCAQVKNQLGHNPLSGHLRVSSTGQQALSGTDLQLILEGIEVEKVRQFKRFRPAA